MSSVHYEIEYDSSPLISAVADWKRALINGHYPEYADETELEGGLAWLRQHCGLRLSLRIVKVTREVQREVV